MRATIPHIEIKELTEVGPELGDDRLVAVIGGLSKGEPGGLPVTGVAGGSADCWDPDPGV